MTPQQKAALLVVSGPRAARALGGVLVQRWDPGAPRPSGAVVYADQEGGAVRALRGLPPRRAAAEYTNAKEAYSAGVATAHALQRAGVDVDLAPVLDLSDGPLGNRQFRSPLFGIAFAREPSEHLLPGIADQNGEAGIMRHAIFRHRGKPSQGREARPANGIEDRMFHGCCR